MKTFLFIFLLFSTSAFALPEFSLMSQSQEPQLVVNNRILAKINGKTISVIDVMKKMDVYLTHTFPESVHTPMNRYQFYVSNWRMVLEQMIDHELIIADSEEKEIKAADSEIREQMMTRFGPNIMVTLDKIGLTYEEARDMIATELAVQKMTWFRVNNKALQKVGPQDIKLAYKEYCEKNPPLETWKYQVLSLRADTEENAQKLAEKAYLLLQENDVGETPLSSVADALIALYSDVSITVSPDYDANNRDISASHASVLSTLTPSSYSKPVSQVSRVGGNTVFRIFLLKEHNITPTRPFEKVSDELYNILMQEAVALETGTYIQKIRNRYSFDASSIDAGAPADFEPFALR